MTQRTGGMRRKTRYKLKKHIKGKGKVSVTDYFKTFKIGDKVRLAANTSIQKGMYFPRFHGLSGDVRGKRGKCYEIEIKRGRKTKMMIVHPVHLEKI